MENQPLADEVARNTAKVRNSSDAGRGVMRVIKAVLEAIFWMMMFFGRDRQTCKT